ncbi:MAG: valine--tRNA ligase [bacterium]
MPTELAKAYEPKAVESKWYAAWEKHGLFHVPDAPKNRAYCIVIPPPNVTGALHMGHALNNTLQDILIRWKRMEGFAALWQPGTDHAGIATQNVVEREILKKEGKRRQEIGREALIERIWKWREEYGDRILLQLRALGSSCDWERTRFTLDEGLSRAVRECFVRLYDEGLIYRGKYIVNWCPRCHTALADDEVDHKDEKGSLWHIRYPFADGTGFVTVATTRPETLLGDTAVAVNPKDERYAHLEGKMVQLPETNRQIPIVADDFVDSTFGTGCVKVTPAHDPNDFMIGERHNLPRINVMNEDATMSAEAGAEYAGLKRDACREKIVEALKNAGLLEKIEDHQHAVGHCYRCHTTIEPWLSDQWFVRMRPLAEAAIRATEEGKVKFHPERWTQFYLQWLENARDWCISRQIWWGHRIPVWYCKNPGPGTRNLEPGKDFPGSRSPVPGPDSGSGSQVPGPRSGSLCPPIVARETPTKCPNCGGQDIRQDDDVLDTWFSSALWPFSTLGWPEKTETLAHYYPTSTLVTDRGIIYFWVARMVMMGLKMMNAVPFSDVYIHGTILDEQGRKMSKSLGNGIDPLDIIDKYGADAMRFSLVVLSTEGQDLKLSESKFDMGRNFCNKLWNAARFAMMNLEDAPATAPSDDDLNLADRWILNRLAITTSDVRAALSDFKFSVAAQSLYQFVWNEFCDWYVEAAKLHLNDRENARSRAATQHTLKTALSSILKLLHPFLPFITEEIWGTLMPGHGMLIVGQYPNGGAAPFEKDARVFEITVKEPVEAIRNIRGESNLAPTKRIPQAVSGFNDPETVLSAVMSGNYVEHLARVDSFEAKLKSELGDLKEVATNVTANQVTVIPLAGLIDVAAERARLEKEIARAAGEIEATARKLGNESFIVRAPADIVEKERQRMRESEEKIEKLKAALIALG